MSPNDPGPVPPFPAFGADDGSGGPAPGSPARAASPDRTVRSPDFVIAIVLAVGVLRSVTFTADSVTATTTIRYGEESAFETACQQLVG